MKKLAFLVILMAGCDPAQPSHCDYCHVFRESVTRYYCDKCKGSHAACRMDEKLCHYEESVGIRGGRIQTPVYVTVCPNPEGPSKEAVKEPAKEPADDQWDSHRFKLRDLPWLMFMILCGLIGYARGRQDGARVTARKFMK